MLADMAGRNDPLMLSDLRSLQQKYKPDDTRPIELAIKLLSEYGLLDATDESGFEWEVPHIVGEFLRHLTMRQRLAAPGQLTPLIDEIAHLTEDFRQAVEQEDVDLVRIAGTGLKQGLDAARALSQQNHQAVLHEIMRIKSRQDNRSLRERYLFITQLQERHLTPLGALVDVGGAMEQRAAELIAVARGARERMSNNPYVPEIATRIIASVRKLKDVAWTDFHSCLREVTPLFKQIRRDHALAASVSTTLERVGREGVRALDEVVAQLPIARWRPDGLFSAYVLTDYLAGVAEHANRPDPGPIRMDEAAGRTDPSMKVLDFEQAALELRAAGQQPDLLQWLFACYPDFPEQQRLHGMMHLGAHPDFAVSIGDSRALLETADADYSYFPIRIARA
ncbi:hypothetical protein CCR84_15555 [Rhodocyclus purpureus]|nr:hypothetical protein [Rhodocyclus purpureus]